MKKVAGIIVKDPKGRVLVIHARKHPDNRWGIPKGRIDKGESPKTAAIREFYEETGINLKKYRKKIKKLTKKALKHKELHVFTLKVKKPVKGKVNTKEIDGMSWIKPRDFRYIGERTQRKLI